MTYEVSYKVDSARVKGVRGEDLYDWRKTPIPLA